MKVKDLVIKLLYYPLENEVYIRRISDEGRVTEYDIITKLNKHEVSRNVVIIEIE